MKRRSLARSLCGILEHLFPRPRRGGRAACPAQLGLERLEDRFTPAQFSESGATLIIALDNTDEQVTITSGGGTYSVAGSHAAVNAGVTAGRVTFSGNNATVTAAGLAAYTNFQVQDAAGAAGTGVTFGDSGANAYTDQFSVLLDDPGAGRVTFTGATTFSNRPLIVNTAGNILGTSGSSLTLTGAAGSLDMTASGQGSIVLLGGVRVGATTALRTGGAGDVQAANAANDFTGLVTLSTGSGGDVRLNDSTALPLSNCTFGGAADVTAGGSMTQAAGTFIQTTAFNFNILRFTSTGGSVTLDRSNNFGSARVSLRTSAANNATLNSVADVTLADCLLDAGNLSVTAKGQITQGGVLGVRTGGNATFTVDTVNASDVDVRLNSLNRIEGTVTIAQVNGGDVDDVNLRNISPAATFPVLPAGLRELRLSFENTGVALPALNLTGGLSVEAAGPITQTGNLTVGGDFAAFQVLGDFGIDLSTHTNTVNAGVSFRAGQSSQDVRYSESGDLTLSDADLGRGAVFLSATGNVTQTAGLRQRPGGGPITVTTTAGTTINLLDPDNRISSAVLFAGAGLQTVGVANSSGLAAFPPPGSLPGTVTSLTLEFANSAVVLPALTIGSLDVTAAGIFQQPGSVLTVPDAHFDALGFSIDLPGANDFNDLELDNAGPNNVRVNDVDGVNFAGSSDLGSGRVTVTAGGAITQAAGSSITQEGDAGPITFTTAAAAITLNNAANAFTGPVSLNNTGASSVTFQSSSLVLGACNVGGALSVTTSAGDIRQAVATALTVGGNATCTAGGSGDVVLDNPGNAFAGSVGVSAVGDAAVVRDSTALVLGAVTAATLDVTAGGAITQTGVLTVGTAHFQAGGDSITLNNSGNDFGIVSLSSTGAAVSLRDANALQLADVTLGATALTVQTAGALTQVGDTAITQTGPSAVTLNVGAANRIDLSSADNELAGAVVATARDVSLASRHNLTVAAGSVITGELSLSAGGQVTLGINLTLTSLIVEAQRANISTDLSVTGGTASFLGDVAFTGNRTLTADDVEFDGDVIVGGTLTLNVADGGEVQLREGVWNQGTNALTINGALATFTIGDFGQGARGGARFVMTGGTLSMPGGGDVTVEPDGTFQVGDAAGAAETVTLANGPGQLIFDGGALGVGLGATNDRLVKAGGGNVVLQVFTPGRLVGTGLAGAVATPVLSTPAALVEGTFAQSTDAGGAAVAFRAGSDVVLAGYQPAEVTVMRGGVEDADGVVSGVLPGGDGYVVRSTLGGTARLVVVETPDGQLDVVVRNNNAPATLSIRATSGGSTTPVRGIAVNGPGAVTILAPAANVEEEVRVQNALSSLTLRDMTQGDARILSGGAATSLTSLAIPELEGVFVSIGGVLNSLKAEFLNDVALEAERFGTLAVTDSMNARLTNRALPAGRTPAVALVRVGGLSGEWDVRGAVGSVTAFSTDSWVLGTAGPGTRNLDGLTSVTALRLGRASSTEVRVAGRITAVKAVSWSDGTLRAASFGTIQTTGNPGANDAGDFDGAVVATGNAGGATRLALGTLSVAGNLDADLTFDNGNVTQVAAGRTLSGAITAAAGKITTLRAAGIDGLTVEARAITTLKVAANPTAGLTGGVEALDLTLGGPAVALGTFSASGDVVDSAFTVLRGNVTAFSVGRELRTSTITLADGASGALATMSAARWDSTHLTARSIGALSAGEVVGSSVAAYGGGTKAAATTIAVKGSLLDSVLNAPNGITTLTVGRRVGNSRITVDAAGANVGRIAAVTVGAWSDSELVANTLGTFKVAGFAQPEIGNVVSGSLERAAIVVNGEPTGLPALGALTAAEVSDSSLRAYGGIGASTVTGGVRRFELTTDNPLNPNSGRIGRLTAGSLDGGSFPAAHLRATSIGTLQVNGNLLNLAVEVRGTAATPEGPVAIGKLTVAGTVSSLTLDVPGTITAFSVGDAVANSSLAAGYGPGGRLVALTAGEWLSATLTTRHVNTFTIAGNTATNLAGDLRNAFLDVFGGVAGVGLGTVSVKGVVEDSLVTVSAGDVTAFTALAFVRSDLLVGARLSHANDLDSGVTFTSSGAIGSFTTTRPLTAGDPDSFSFIDSNVVASRLGAITLNGVDPAADDTESFGVAFQSVGGAAGAVKTDGVTRSPGFTSGKFRYLGL